MTYVKQTWENYPSIVTPISSARLTHMEDGIFGAANVFNVKSYGAVGNGSTDDAVAIQAAINACAAEGGGIVFIPEGTYIIQVPLAMPSWTPIHIKGSGFSSILKAKASADLPSVLGDGGAAARVWSCVLEDFTIDGNLLNGNPDVVGVYLCGHGTTVQRVWTDNCYVGVNLSRVPTDPGNYWGGCNVLSSQASNCDHQGFVLPVDSIIAYSGVGEIGVRAGWSEPYGTCGISIISWDCRVIGNHVWGVNGPAIWCNWVEHVGIHNNVIERTYGSYVHLVGRAYLANITGNVFEDKTVDPTHDALDWTGVPFITVNPNPGEKQAVLISNNMFSEISGKARGFVISENANADYGLYTNNIALIAGTSAFANLEGPHSVEANNIVRGLA